MPEEDIRKTRLWDSVPSDPMDQIRRFAYDLAWGCLYGWWNTKIVYTRSYIESLNDQVDIYSSEQHPANDDPLLKYVLEVWRNYGYKEPKPSLLQTLEYIEKEGTKIFYHITAWSLALLEGPRPNSIFISYSRKISSALAMFIRAELVARRYNVFLDTYDLYAGDEWQKLLQSRVRESNIFIVILGKDRQENDFLRTIDSPSVQDEVIWALEEIGLGNGVTAQRKIIPILHGEFTPHDLKSSAEPFNQLWNKQVIPIKRDVAEDIQAGLEKLFYALEYGLPKTDSTPDDPA